MIQPVQLRYFAVPCFAGSKHKNSSGNKPLSRAATHDDTVEIGKAAKQTSTEQRSGEEKDWHSVVPPEDDEVKEQEQHNKQRENEEFLEKYSGMVSHIRGAENHVKATSRWVGRKKNDVIETVKGRTKALAVSSLELIAHKFQTAAYQLQQQPRATDRDDEVSSIISRESGPK